MTEKDTTKSPSQHGNVSDLIDRAFSMETRIRRGQIACADGATVSIQASAMHYALPRDNAGPYTHIEAGFPSVTPPDSWLEYADNPDDAPTDTVYCYMPFACVHEFIAAHGGMVSGDLPEEAK